MGGKRRSGILQAARRCGERPSGGRVSFDILVRLIAWGVLLEIIGTPPEEGGTAMDLTVFRMVAVPETGTLWLRVVGGYGWTRIGPAGFLRQ